MLYRAVLVLGMWCHCLSLSETLARTTPGKSGDKDVGLHGKLLSIGFNVSSDNNRYCNNHLNGSQKKLVTFHHSFFNVLWENWFYSTDKPIDAIWCHKIDTRAGWRNSAIIIKATGKQPIYMINIRVSFMPVCTLGETTLCDFNRANKWIW